jgi:hypothetical protein
MPYNPYYPQSYSPYQQAMPQYQQQQNSSGLIWVQGIEAMKSYPVTPGQSVLLMDSESNCFGIKTVDTSGMPLPLRIFDYQERTAQNPQPVVQSTAQLDTSDFVTREEFEARIAEIMPKRKTKPEGAEKNAE